MNASPTMPRPREPLTDDSIHSTVREYLSRDPTEAWKPIGTWDVSQVTNMSNLFQDTGFNESLSNWDTSQVTDMSSMFCRCTAFNQPVVFDTSRVTDMRAMFNTCAVFNQPVEFDTSRVTDMHTMFGGCTVFNQPVLLNTSQVTDMSGMFYKCTAFNQPVPFDTSRVTDMCAMFYGCAVFNQPVVFDTSQVTNMAHMFCGCTAFNQPVEFDTSRVTDMHTMFNTCTVFNQPVPFDTSRVTDMHFMFSRCAAFNQPVLFNTSQVEDMCGMFGRCTAFNQPLMFDTSRVTNMSGMFDKCASFNQLVTFDIVQVTNMGIMFNECISLTQQPVFASRDPQVINDNMFYGTPLQPPPPPRQPPPPQPPAVAMSPATVFEVHNVFARINMRKLLDLIRVTEHVDTGNYAQLAFGEHVDQKLREFIVNNVPEDKRADILNSYNRVSFQIKHFTFTETSISHINGVEHTVPFGQIVDSVIAFVETRSSKLIATYMETFVSDCVTAYAAGNTISCTRGIIERLVSSLGNLAGTTDADDPAMEQLYINLAREVGGVDEANPGASVIPSQVAHFAAICVNEIKTSLLEVDEANMEERRRLLRNGILEKLELPVTTESSALTTYLNRVGDVLNNEFLEGLDGGG